MDILEMDLDMDITGFIHTLPNGRFTICIIQKSRTQLIEVSNVHGGENIFFSMKSCKAYM